MNNTCLNCDQPLDTRSIAKYCEDCKIKQRQAKVKRTVEKNKKFSVVKFRKQKDIIIECKYCGKMFKTRTSAEGVQRQCCSAICGRAYGQSLLNGLPNKRSKKKRKKATAPVVLSVSVSLNELTSNIKQSVQEPKVQNG